MEKDGNHVEIEAERVPKESARDVENYVMHQDCWHSISDGWMEP